MSMSLSYVAGACETPLVGRTIGAQLDAIVARGPDRDALVSCRQQQRYTYRGLQREAGRVARALLASGVMRGDRVAIWSGSRTEWVVLQYAVTTIGAIFVTINPAYRLDEVRFALRQAGVTVLVAAPRYLEHDNSAILSALRESSETSAGLPESSLRTVLLLDEPARPVEGGVTWAAFVARHAQVPMDAVRARSAECQFDDPALILYTSGTTGRPKGVTLSHHAVLNCALSMGARLRCGADDRLCLPVPLYHCLGAVMGVVTALAAGSAIVLPGEAFEPCACLQTIEHERCTMLYGVPTMFIALLAHPAHAKTRLDSLRTGIMAGAPCPVELMQHVVTRMHMPEVTICYGMTETPPVTQTHPGDRLEDRVSTVGAVLPHVECKIVDPGTGRVVPRGQPGEICVRGYGVTRGYWCDEAATQALIDAAGWLHTGDLGAMRDDERIVISGRSKDVIIRGGENIDPREIEQILHAHPKVLDAYVVGVPDVHYGEETCAWVRLRAGEQATASELRRHCRERLASHKIPRYVYFSDTFPTTATGKVQKFRLRELAASLLVKASA